MRFSCPPLLLCRATKLITWQSNFRETSFHVTRLSFSLETVTVQTRDICRSINIAFRHISLQFLSKCSVCRQFFLFCRSVFPDPLKASNSDLVDSDLLFNCGMKRKSDIMTTIGQIEKQFKITHSDKIYDDCRMYKDRITLQFPWNASCFPPTIYRILFVVV